jgi:hypothetical protein
VPAYVRGRSRRGRSSSSGNIPRPVCSAMLTPGPHLQHRARCNSNGFHCESWILSNAISSGTFLKHKAWT